MRPSTKAVCALLVVSFVVALASYLTQPRRSITPPAPLLMGAHIDSTTRRLLERSCQDCHSESTHYPWYSYIVPFSWLIHRDVRQGREHLNLSRWGEYPLVRRERALSEIANQVSEGEMPLWLYTAIHPKAKLSKSDSDAIFQWTQAERQRLIQESLEESGTGSIGVPLSVGAPPSPFTSEIH